MLLMPVCHPRAIATAAVLFCIAAISGCGASPPPGFVVPKGKVTKAGQPLTVKPMVGLVEVIFLREAPEGTPVDPQIAKLNPDGTFVVHGTGGQGLEPGKYKIVVRQWDEYPNLDLLQGAFDEKRTKIVRDVNGTDEILIDVSKPAG